MHTSKRLCFAVLHHSAIEERDLSDQLERARGRVSDTSISNTRKRDRSTDRPTDRLIIGRHLDAERAISVSREKERGNAM